MPHNPKIVFIGYANTTVNTTPAGSSQYMGGAATYAAIAASKFVQPIGLITRVGHDFDDSFLPEGVLRGGIKVVPDKESAVLSVNFPTTDLSLQPSVKLDLNAAQDLSPLDIPTDWYKNATIIHIATMHPKLQKLFIDFLLTHAPGIILTADTGYSFLQEEKDREIAIENFQNCKIVFLNKAEYALLENDVIALQDVILKKDRSGAEYLKGGSILVTQRAPEVVVKDVMGAGDILAGAFLANILKGQTTEQSLKLAVNLASQSVTEIGVKHLLNSIL